MGASTVEKRLPERSPGLRWRNAARGEGVRKTMILAPLLLPSDFLLMTDPNSKLMGEGSPDDSGGNDSVSYRTGLTRVRMDLEWQMENNHSIPRVWGVHYRWVRYF